LHLNTQAKCFQTKREANLVVNIK